jgi:hypothetical protein
MNGFDEPNGQQRFNTMFIVKLNVFMVFYMFYAMHIDPNAIVMNSIEKLYNNLADELD